MKTLAPLLLFLLIVPQLVFSQTMYPVIEHVHPDTVFPDETPQCYFVIKNNSNEPIWIRSAISSTERIGSPTYSKDLIAPGRTSRIDYSIRLQGSRGPKDLPITVHLSNDSFIVVRTRCFGAYSGRVKQSSDPKPDPGISPKPTPPKTQSSTVQTPTSTDPVYPMIIRQPGSDVADTIQQPVKKCPCNPEIPLCPGGMNRLAFTDSLVKLTSKQVKPTVTGNFAVFFKIDAQGNVIDAYVLHSVDPKFEAAILRNLPLMGKWTPACQYKDMDPDPQGCENKKAVVAPYSLFIKSSVQTQPPPVVNAPVSPASPPPAVALPPKRQSPETDAGSRFLVVRASQDFDTVARGDIFTGYFVIQNQSTQTVKIDRVYPASMDKGMSFCYKFDFQQDSIHPGDSARIGYHIDTRFCRMSTDYCLDVSFSNYTSVYSCPHVFIKDTSHYEVVRRNVPVDTCICNYGGPEYPGGYTLFRDSLVELTRRKVTPVKSGTCAIQVIVAVDGSLINPVVIKSVDPKFEAELLRNLNKPGKWIPACTEGFGYDHEQMTPPCAVPVPITIVVMIVP